MIDIFIYLSACFLGGVALVSTHLAFKYKEEARHFKRQALHWSIEYANLVTLGQKETDC